VEHASPVGAGDSEGDPGIETLPEHRHAKPDFTERMKFGVILAEQSFLLEAPAVPAARDTLTLQEWSDTELAAWLEEKTRAVEAARRELDAAADEAHRQRILAGAIVGLMYEDVGRVLRAIPIPDDLRDEPEIADAFQYVVEGNAAPFIEHARRAYRACAANAVEPEDMQQFSTFCAARAERLPDAAHESGPNGTVEVTVIADRN
jgi:hypothetical protein